MAKSEIVTFLETLKKDTVTQDKVDSGYATPIFEVVKEVVEGKEVEKETGKVLKYVHKGEVTYNFPETLEEAVQMWGEEVVLNKCVATVRIDVGKVAKACETPDQSQAAADSFVPGVSRRGTGSISQAALVSGFKNLSAEDQKKILAMLQGN